MANTSRRAPSPQTLGPVAWIHIKVSELLVGDIRSATNGVPRIGWFWLMADGHVLVGYGWLWLVVVGCGWLISDDQPMIAFFTMHRSSC